jgi:hypothetical protein
MKLTELKSRLNEHPDANVRFFLPNGDSVPAHAHVTEVARIDKRFVDCGGTLRNDSLCRLQTWFSDDVDHRLTAGKLVKILEKAKSFLVSDDLEVDVEHTACLALDKCKPPAASDFNPLKFNFREGQPSSDCCADK